MEQTSQDRTDAFREELQILLPELQSRASHWRSLSQAIRSALSYARQSPGEPARRILESLAPYEQTEPLSWDHLQAFQQVGRTLLAYTSALPDRNTKGSPWLALHSTIEQHMAVAGAGIAGLQTKIMVLLQELGGTPGLECLAAAGREALDQCRNLSLPALEALVAAFQSLLDALRDQTLQDKTNLAHTRHTRHFLVAVIEDEETWRTDVLRAIEQVRRTLGRSFILDTLCFDNAQEADEALTAGNWPSSAADGNGTPVEVQVIAVVDMGLPANPTDREMAQQGRTTPDRSNGHALLGRLREYRVNIPCIVLTVSPELLSDQLRAARHGVEEYVLKEPDKLPYLAEAILRVIRRSQAHQVSLRRLPEYVLRIDGVPIPIGEMAFRTLYALCELSQSTQRVDVYFSAGEVLEQLEKSFGEVYSYLRDPETPWEKAQVLAAERGEDCWRASQLVHAANVIHLWAVCKAEENGDPPATLRRLKGSYPAVWQGAVDLLADYCEAHPDSGPWAGKAEWSPGWRELTEGLEVAFGGLGLEGRQEYDPKNVIKHMTEIRRAIHHGFQAAHRSVRPEEILEGRRLPETYAYRVRAAMDLDGDADPTRANLSAIPAHQTLRALLVENDPAYLDRMRGLLEGLSLVVETATNVEDALQRASISAPDILSLDMHIPATRREWERDPYNGDPHGGLSVLAKIRQEAPGVKVVIPTTLSNQGDIRQRAGTLGVPVAAFVPKGESPDGAPWEGHYLLTVSRLRQEILQNAVLPPLPDWRCPVVQVLPGSDPDSGRLLLRVNGRQSSFQRKEGKLASLLLQRPEQVVRYEEIDTAVWGGPQLANTRNQKLNDVRQKIRIRWLLEIPPDDERPELSILEAVDGGVVLHAHVEGI